MFTFILLTNYVSFQGARAAPAQRRQLGRRQRQHPRRQRQHAPSRGAQQVRHQIRMSRQIQIRLYFLPLSIVAGRQIRISHQNRMLG